MQRWIVKYFFQVRPLQSAGLDIDVPIFCHESRLIQIEMRDVQGRPVK